MRTPLIAGNWKMFKTVNEAVVFVKDLRDLVKGISGVDIVVAPPFTAAACGGRRGAGEPHRHRSAELYSGTRRRVHRRGLAGDGQGSRRHLRDRGPPERRRLFGETDAIVNRKTPAAIGAGPTPIVCIGETLEERERGECWRSSTGRSRTALISPSGADRAAGGGA
jgi:triosephosphate isomerase